MRTMSWCLGAVICTAGCFTGGSSSPDGGATPTGGDAGGDTHNDDLDCVRIDGVFVDLASTAATVLGVEGATVTHRDSSKEATTSHAGGFGMCIPHAPSYTFDVDAPGDLLDAIVVDGTANALRSVELRMMTAARANALYAVHGMQFDPARAHILVATFGTGGEVALEGAGHGAALAANIDEQDGSLVWTPGTAGTYVLFPNVAITETPTTVSFFGLLDLTATAPRAPGVLTIVGIGTWFCAAPPCV